MNIERLLQKIKTLNIVIQSSKEHTCIFSIIKLAAFWKKNVMPNGIIMPLLVKYAAVAAVSFGITVR